MATRKQALELSVYQLKITLKGSKPPIWRRIQVTNDITLHHLHQILQVVMGWEDYHLHQFMIGGTYYGRTDPDYGADIRSENNVKLNQVVKSENFKFDYEYDFGDGWSHQIVVEKILPLQVDIHYPLCLAGKRACPPEDCGGIWGYAELLEVLQDPEHPEYEERLEWLGNDFEPEAFALDEVNQILQNFK